MPSWSDLGALFAILTTGHAILFLIISMIFCLVAIVGDPFGPKEEAGVPTAICFYLHIPLVLITLPVLWVTGSLSQAILVASIEVVFGMVIPWLKFRLHGKLPDVY